MFNAADRKHIRAAEKAERAAAVQRRDVLRGLMSVMAGRAWIYDILSGCHIFSSSFATNALATAFSEGERNVGLKLLNDLMSFCPDEYILMLREANERQFAADQRTVEPEHYQLRADDDSGDIGEPDLFAGYVSPGDDEARS